MRKCIHCEIEMIEDYDVKVEGAAYGLKITKPGIFKDNLGKVHAAVCPECGHIFKCALIGVLRTPHALTGLKLSLASQQRF